MTIALYGATGYTGKLVAAELHRRDLPFVLGGRDPEKLQSLSHTVGGAPWRAATADDPASLEAFLEGSSALINCAGPFASVGEPVVGAAIASGVHYVDSTGEQAFMHRVLTTQDRPAREAGVAVVPGMGFDFAPGDCIAALSADGLGKLDSLAIGYDVEDWAMGRGSMHTALEILQGGRGLRHDAGETAPGPGRVRSRRFDFGPDAGSAACAFYASGEALTVPQHVDVNTVDCYMSARSVVPRPLASLFPIIRPVLAASLKTPLRRILDAGIRRLPEGPDPEARAAARFRIVAEARASGGQTRRGLVTGRNTYGMSATLLVWAAEHMSRPDYKPTGALAPAQAFDPEALLGAISDHDIRWQVD